ncbi:hypothetical protein LRP49_00985 [Enterovibrio sp. ZSDZ35]|uniref:Uncharacterized protein n=1 Tax=Enterovibrio qingdaonensis TaxID=2899818 RepID=A0ABT5QFJ9_9GAMM|nr:hypothetical protein [Enterovibrio sp. ZSDZ35]MDD1779756.1 hypothetical protein [Enterovibrio sp. ZSDZ35]
MNTMAKSLITTAVLIGLATSSATFAKDGFLNGKPFEYLKSKVDANADAISTLNEITANLTADIAAINATLEVIENDVESNKADIQEINSLLLLLEDAVDVNADNIDALRASIDLLQVQHDNDIAQLLTDIGELRASIDNLRSTIDGALAQLGTTVDQLQLEVDANTGNIQSLLVSSVNALADIVAMQSILDDHEARLVDAESHLTSVDLQIADINDRLDAINLRLDGLDTAVAGLQAFHTSHFTGVLNDVPIDDLNGWTQCFSALYSDTSATAAKMQSQCTKPHLIVACRATGDTVLRVMAEAPREDVFNEDGSGRNVSRLVNGAQWYFSNNYSMGFAPAGEAVRRSSADTLNMGSNDRLSWHTHSSYNAGWRCGDRVGLNGSSAWEKLIFEADF